MRRTPKLLLATLLASQLVVGMANAGPDPAALKKSVDAGVQYLKTTQSDDGSWTTSKNPGITALATYALLANGVGVDDPAVAKGLKQLESHMKDDGGIYATDSTHRNYETSVVVLALEAANEDGRYDDALDHAVKFLKGLQWDEDEVGESTHTSYGGAGYGGSQRPDLSNTAFFMEALHSAGVPEDDPAMQKALIFVSRCQNLESEYNNTPFATKVNDGGFYYTVAAGGGSPAGKTDNGGLRSYAAMTYAGLKSMIYAGLTPDDPRVKAAEDWISQHYSVEENPGVGQSGLYYYYHTFAKALNVLGEDEFQDASGTSHDWRKELAGHLADLQKDNGSWVNEAERWMEGDPNLVTAYSLMALQYCGDSE